MVRVVLVPTPIPPAAANEEGNDCNGRGRMWAGEREQSVGYSVTETLIYQKRCLMLLLDEHYVCRLKHLMYLNKNVFS